MLTGLEIIQIMASGQCFAQAVVKVATMLALVLNRSSRVIPRTHPAEYFKLPAAYSLKGRLPNQSVLPWTAICQLQLLVSCIKRKLPCYNKELAPKVTH